MNRALNGLADLFSDDHILASVLVVGGVMWAMAVNYQAGHTMIGWSAFGYFMPTMFGLVVFAVVSALLQNRADILFTLWSVSLGLALFGAEPANYPGLHLKWWWLALAVGISAYYLVFQDREEDRYVGDWYYKPRGLRFSVVLIVAAATMSVTALLVYGLTALIWVIPVVAVLGVLARLVLTRVEERHYSYATA